MPASSLLADALAERLGRLLSDAGGRERPALLSITMEVPPADPLDLFAAAAGERFLWCQPSEGFAIVGAGVAARMELGHGQGAADASARWQRLRAQCVVDVDSSCPLRAPVAVGGFAFDASREPGGLWARLPYGLVVPRFAYLANGASSWVNVNVGFGLDGSAQTVPAAVEELSCWLRAAELAGEDAPVTGLASASQEPGLSAWRSAVSQVLGAIERGEVEKVVLARRVRVRSERPIAVSPVLRRLREGYPQCTVFAYARGDACFLGATPERLVRLWGSHVAADPLAGSAPRGKNDAEDQLWADALLADEKERREHSLVVRALAEALAPLCSALDVPASPSVLRVSNVQHLHSLVRGVLSSRRDVLDLVARLHPTPATGGWPVKRALEIIRALEPFDRGWYAGPVGWVDGKGDGEFAVAIRSALVSGPVADLFAGCGIVSGSDREREEAESGLKLRAMLWALGGEVE